MSPFGIGDTLRVTVEANGFRITADPCVRCFPQVTHSPGCPCKTCVFRASGLVVWAQTFPLFPSGNNIVVKLLLLAQQAVVSWEAWHNAKGHQQSFRPCFLVCHKLASLTMGIWPTAAPRYVTRPVTPLGQSWTVQTAATMSFLH